MNINTNFFERLNAIASKYGYSGIPELSKDLGYKSPEKLYRLDRKEGAKPSIDIVLDLTNKFESLNIEWFLTGEGEIEKGKFQANEGKPEYRLQKFVAPSVVTVDETGQDNIVLVNEKAAAGYLAGYGDTEYIHSLPAYHLPNLTNGTFRMFQVSGHSMYPTLHQGSFVVGEWVENLQTGVKDDRVYIIVSEVDGIIVKRVLNRLDKYGALYCKSDNRREYPNLSVNENDIAEVWEVKLHLSFELPNPADVYDRVNDLEAKMMFLEDKLKRKK